MKVFWKTCEKELGGEMKSAYETYSIKVHHKISKSHSLLEKLM